MNDRKCALDGCGESWCAATFPKRLHCSQKHAWAAAARRCRAKQESEKVDLYVVCVAQCPVDGRLFSASKRLGRPRTYDCDECKRIARALREMARES